MKRLDECLIRYSKEDYYPFHMPGHKRHMEAGFCSNPFSVDITEIEGFDNLHQPGGVIARAEERAAGLYGADESWYLVNGSTCGILTAISACTSLGGEILMARNCHKAAYHAAYLRQLKVSYLMPETEESYGINGGITIQEVEAGLREHPHVQAVFITSPTYDGVVSDIEAIAAAVHEKGIPLLVDEAHGAHFGMHPYFPESAVKKGADLVIQSLHKTMPALTQTALLHRKGNRVSVKRIRQFLSIYQTSSPSYVLMGSMDACMGMMETEGRELFHSYVEKLQVCRKRLENLTRLSLVSHRLKGKHGIYRMDPSKLLLHTKGTDVDGPYLYQKLYREYHLQMEMAAPSYVLGMTSVMDSVEGYDRLCRACEEIDSRLTFDREKKILSPSIRPLVIKSIARTLESEARSLPFHACAGRIAAEYIYLYPPGIPLVAPGELLTEELLEQIRTFQSQGLFVQGPADESLQELQVLNGKWSISRIAGYDRKE